MIFTTVRLMFALLIFLVLYFSINKTETSNKRKKCVISLMICIVVFFASGCLLIENLFVNFKTPEAVVRYTTTDFYERVDFVVEGEKSCLVYCRKNQSNFFCDYVGKRDDSYKILSNTRVKTVVKRFDSNVSFDILNIRGTNDYYCRLTDTYQEIRLFNEKENNIDIDIKKDAMGFSWFYFNDYNDGYYLILDGEKVALTK